MNISNSADIRVSEGGQLVIHPTAKIDDDVRIVVSSTGKVMIGPNSKIGKGSIINCGGLVEIGESVAVYGYCYFQSSIWTNGSDGRVYDHGSIIVGDQAIISPFCVLSHSARVSVGEIVPPHSVRGNWFNIDADRNADL